MIHVLPSTLLQQQSFYHDWVIGDHIDMLGGVIISCQVTTTSASPVMLSAMTYNSGEMSIVLTQDGEPCAYGSTHDSNSIVRLTVNNSATSATIETGFIPRVSYNCTFKNARINPSYVNVIKKERTIGRALIIKQDDYTTRYELAQDIPVKLSNNLDGAIDGGTLTISMSDEEYLAYTKLGDDIIKPTRGIRTINGVRPKDGVINIDIYHEGQKLSVASVKENWCELGGSTIPFCPSFVDPIDSYLAPYTHVGYLPLDDMYPDGSNRKTEVAERLKYGWDLKSLDNPSSGKFNLFDIDSNIDTDKGEI